MQIPAPEQAEGIIFKIDETAFSAKIIKDADSSAVMGRVKTAFDAFGS